MYILTLFSPRSRCGGGRIFSSRSRVIASLFLYQSRQDNQNVMHQQTQRECISQYKKWCTLDTAIAWKHSYQKPSKPRKQCFQSITKSDLPTLYIFTGTETKSNSGLNSTETIQLHNYIEKHIGEYFIVPSVADAGFLAAAARAWAAGSDLAFSTDIILLCSSVRCKFCIHFAASSELDIVT